MTWDVLDAQWEENFKLLEEYRDREGHCDVPGKHEERGAKLGAWLNYSSGTARKKGVLDAAERRLEEAGVTWDPIDAQWEKNFKLLEEYRDREGHCDVPAEARGEGAKLGDWLDAGSGRAQKRRRHGRRERAAARGGGA